jgi:hypothetical protein
MDLQKLLDKLQKRRGDIVYLRASINAEELKIWRLREKILKKLQNNSK